MEARVAVFTVRYAEWLGRHLPGLSTIWTTVVLPKAPFFVRAIPLGFVILSEAPLESYSHLTDGRAVEGSRRCMPCHAASGNSHETTRALARDATFTPSDCAEWLEGPCGLAEIL